MTAAAEGVGGVVPDGSRGDLLEEVANLVESPTVVLGSFDPAFLALPRWADAAPFVMPEFGLVGGPL